MSMQLLTFIQFIYIVMAYLGVMVLLPAAVFYPFFQGRSLGIKFIGYLAIGNFYVINLVFLLQFLHIANPVTLWIGVLGPAIVAICKIHWNTWAKGAITFAGEATYGVLVRTMGLRLLLSKISHAMFQALRERGKNALQKILEHPIDMLGTLSVVVVVLWQYGNVFYHFGYMASDTAVHNYWINAMCDNDLFVAGVYPFGMHCVVYFMNQVFGIRIMNLLRLMGLIQTLLIHLTLLVCLRTFCRNIAVSYGAVLLYAMGSFWNYNTNSRFFSALPQEYGMIFILPGICFLFQFLERRREEDAGKSWKAESTLELLLFGMCFALTFMVHFYDTMILGLFCIAVAVVSVPFLFRKEVFGRLFLTGVLSIVVAVFPMVLAYVLGTPLEGSLKWGMSIVRENETVPPAESKVSPNQSGTSQMNQTQPLAQEGISQSTESGIPVENQIKSSSLWERGISLFRELSLSLENYIASPLGLAVPGLMLFITFSMLAAGGLCFIWGEGAYGRVLMGTAICVLLEDFLMCAQYLGIPSLMDQNRCSTYLASTLALLFGFAMDVILSVAFRWAETEFLQQALPVGAMIFLLLFLWVIGWIREPGVQKGLEKNGAILCVTNILRENKSGTFTILSANDELRMVEREGYFYEISRFLQECEGERVEDYLVIPTPVVYVFIEKIPGENMAHSDYRGLPVSYESACRPFPESIGYHVYKGTLRHVLMSKLYFWAKEFESMFENEMTVYYEDEEFVCYKICQNVDRPFDLSIDYGMNTMSPVQ